MSISLRNSSLQLSLCHQHIYLQSLYSIQGEHLFDERILNKSKLDRLKSRSDVLNVREQLVKDFISTSPHLRMVIYARLDLAFYSKNLFSSIILL
jgi:hypothetical protein